MLMGHSVSSPYISKIADYLLFLRKEKRLSVSAVNAIALRWLSCLITISLRSGIALFLTLKRREFRIRNNTQKTKEKVAKMILLSLAYITLLRLSFCISTGEREGGGVSFRKKKKKKKKIDQMILQSSK